MDTIQFSGNSPAGTGGAPAIVVPPATLNPLLALRSTVPRSPPTPRTAPVGPDPTPLKMLMELETADKSPLARLVLKVEFKRRCWEPFCVVPFTAAQVAVGRHGIASGKARVEIQSREHLIEQSHILAIAGPFDASNRTGL